MPKVKLIAREDVQISLGERGWFPIKKGQVFYGDSFGGITVAIFENEDGCEYTIMKTSEAEGHFEIIERGDSNG